jgi:hypothetical protein
MTLVIRFEAGLRPVIKHQEHDQKTHGNWATGISSELENWSPKDAVPRGPRNAGGVTEKFWDNWEHGVDGDQFLDLYRQYAGEMLGLPVPKSDKDVGGSEHYLTQPGFGGSSTNTVRKQTEAVLNAIANGRPQPTLYRGLGASDDKSRAMLEEFVNLKEGDTIDLPLVSTTRSLGVAQWYAVDRSYAPTDAKVILKIQEGAKGISVNPEKSWYPSDFETITSGKFEIVGKTQVSVPYWDRRATHARTFKLRGEGTSEGETGYRIQDPNDLSWDSKDSNDPAAKIRYETIRDGANTGNFSKIETSTLKYTNDRQPSGVKDGQDITVNSWSRREPKTFTVIEVKLVEPHVVRKGLDNGLAFDDLFSNVPFIRDAEDVAKHGSHDQKTHGNWATGGGDTAINKFENAANQAYGTGEEAFTIYYTGDNSVAALGEYLARGHTVNDNIRSSGDLDLGDGKTYADSSVVKGLDNAIEMAPRMPNQKVWRTASAEAIENLKVNGVYIDKGFTSTTAVDITHPDNGMLLLTLSTVSSGRKALMEIDTGSVGKGLYIPKMFPGQPIAEKEREFLLPRETKMRYLGSDFNISPSGKTIVEIHKFKVED